MDVQQIVAQFPETGILGDFILRFAQSDWRRERFGYGLAVHLAGEAIEGSMAGIVVVMAMAAWIAAAAASSRNGSGTPIAQLGDLALEGCTLRFQNG